MSGFDERLPACKGRLPGKKKKDKNFPFFPSPDRDSSAFLEN
jgi:hypothetical protein